MRIAMNAAVVLSGAQRTRERERESDICIDPRREGGGVRVDGNQFSLARRACLCEPCV